MNTWMNDPQYLAQIGHFFGAYSLVVTTALACSARRKSFWPTVMIVYGLGFVAAAWKEFWYDLRYELPAQTAGDSTMDFAFYVLGLVVGLLVAEFVVGRIGRKS